MRKAFIVLAILFSLSLVFAQIAFKEKKAPQTKTAVRSDEIDYDAVNNELSETTRDTRIRKEKEKFLNQEIKVKVKESYNAVTNLK
jgi:hypothetical protein